MKSEFEVVFNEIAELRALPRDTVLEALRTALVSAYRRDAGIGNSQRIEATIDPNSGRARIFVEKEVAEDIQDQRTEVDLETARYYEPEAQLGDMVMVQAEGTIKKFGRIAAQTAKQVILQKIREAERNSLYDEFIEREGDIVTGTVQSINSGAVTLSLGRTEATLPRSQQIPGERYKPHDKVRAYIMEVKRSSRGPQIIISRSHRNMLRRLLEFEVPEIYNGQVEIKSIAREAGYRSKVAVAALQEGIDPVGACVGMRGVRIQNIVKELHEEKIDVIEWNPNSEIFIAKALSPARVSGVYLEEDPDTGRTAVVIVPDDQLSLAIGREGQNARLAAKLTGWRIDIKSVTEAVQEALDNLESPSLKDMLRQNADTIAEVQRILEKRAANRAVMPEEFTTLGRFADMVQRRQMAVRDQARQARLAEINAIKKTLPPRVFQMPIEALDIPENMLEVLQPLGNIGEIMWRFLMDEGRLRHLLNGLPEDSIRVLQEALERLVIPEEEEVAPEPEAGEAAAPEAVGEPAAEGEALLRDAFSDEPEEVVSAPAKPQARREFQTAPVEPVSFDEEDEVDLTTGKKKKGKKKGRQLIYDEKLGGMVVKRQRKGSRGRDKGWDDWEE